MVVLKMDTSGLLFVNAPICVDPGLPVWGAFVDLADPGREWVLTRSLLYRSRLLGLNRPIVPIPVQVVSSAHAADQV
jgi:hypothetical protein